MWLCFLCRNINVNVISVMFKHIAMGVIYWHKCSIHKTIATRMDRVTDHSSELHLLTWKHREKHQHCISHVTATVSFSDFACVCKNFIVTNVRFNLEDDSRNYLANNGSSLCSVLQYKYLSLLSEIWLEIPEILWKYEISKIQKLSYLPVLIQSF
jgi:hypothetical protein